jgi:ribose 5-phosphate isomerase B
MDEQRIRRMVRAVVHRTLGWTPGRGRAPLRRVIGEHDLRQLPPRSEFAVPPGSLITPLARQAALDRGISLVEARDALSPSAAAPAPAGGPASAARPIALGADHGGAALKEQLIRFLTDQGSPVIDCGTTGTQPVDYPDYAFAVAELVAQGRAWRGVVIEGAGIGSCMAANKVPGVRAALCYDHATAVNSREHNDANVLTLGAGLIGTDLAIQILTTWLATEFAGGRHARRVDKIMQIEKRFLQRGAS